MAEYNLSNATTTNFSNTVPDFIIDAKRLDTVGENEETYHYFDYAPKYLGYYSSMGEVFSAANSMATWAFGAGWSSPIKAELEHVTGNGKQTFSKVIWNHEVIKLVVGDAFMEIVRSKIPFKNTILNMIPISPERVRIVFGKNGMIKRYDVYNGSDWKPVKKENMLHSVNKQIGDQIHGTGHIKPLIKTLDTFQEAIDDERTIKHRDKALGIVYYKTNNLGKIQYANDQIEKAVKNGEMVGLPEDAAKIESYPGRSSEDRTAWISYNENRLYQTFGVPRSIATSDGTSEVGGKMGNVNFEPTYAKERFDMEDDLWSQLAIKVTFDKQASLGGLVQSDQAKNTGQTSIQPNDVEASLTRE